MSQNCQLVESCLCANERLAWPTASAKSHDADTRVFFNVQNWIQLLLHGTSTHFGYQKPAAKNRSSTVNLCSGKLWEFPT
jgi:hypothetical protein